MHLNYNKDRLDEVCRRYHADSLAVFGSIARGDDKSDSDVDLLVKFSPPNKGGLFELSRMRDDLEKVMNKKVDLLTEGFLSKYFRDEVISETKTIYAKT